MAERYIVDLSRQEIELVSALAHVWLGFKPEDEVAKALITNLKDQTNFTYDDPKRHGVGIRILMPGHTAAEKVGFVIDRTLTSANLTNLLLYNTDNT